MESALIVQRNAAAEAPTAVLTEDDQELVWTVATLMMDVMPQFGAAVTRLIYEEHGGLPKDAPLVEALEAHACEDAREVLVTLRSGMPATAHETPVEAIEHARYLHRRGVGLQSLIDIYQTGFPMFRDLIGLELQARTKDEAQLARISAAADAYAFPFVSTAMARLAVEVGVPDGGWTPVPDDPLLANPKCMEAARQLRDDLIARGEWVADSPEKSGARRDAANALDAFAATIERGVGERDVGNLLALASTTLTVTLTDEPDLSLTLLFDRDPIEIVEAGDAEAELWIASVDLRRIWSPDFYLPIAIAKGRARAEGPIRKFLRVVPVMRGLSDIHEEVVAMQARVDEVAAGRGT